MYECPECGSKKVTGTNRYSAGCGMVALAFIATYVVDAPGFGDIKRDISQKAWDICGKIDIIIYIVNAEGGFKEQGIKWGMKQGIEKGMERGMELGEAKALARTVVKYLVRRLGFVKRYLQ